LEDVVMQDVPQKIKDNAIVPKKDSPLYDMIMDMANGRWQKNKVIDISKRGYTLNGLGELAKQKSKSYDYERSLKTLVERINKNFQNEGALYRIELIDNYYVLVRSD